MPKTPKKEAVTDDTSPDRTGGTAPAPEAAAAPAKKPARSAKTPAVKKSSAKKKSASGAAKKTKAKRPPQQSEAAEPSEADIRLRAYFIAERRVQLALQGDPARDWIEARQQLIAEAQQAQS